MVLFHRDVALVAGAMVMRYQALRADGIDVTLRQYFDMSHPLVISPTFTSKLNTTAQLCLVSIALAAAAFDIPNARRIIGKLSTGQSHIS